jgi:hypothetical protein
MAPRTHLERDDAQLKARLLVEPQHRVATLSRNVRTGNRGTQLSPTRTGKQTHKCGLRPTSSCVPPAWPPPAR